ELVREIDVRGGPVDVDASTVTFMDSAVLALLAHLAYRHQMRLFDPPQAVSFLLETTRLVGWSGWCTPRQPAPETGPAAKAPGVTPRGSSPGAGSRRRSRCGCCPRTGTWRRG